MERVPREWAASTDRQQSLPSIRPPTANPIWQCWLAHVAEVRFSVRRAFVRGVDGQTMRNLHETFLEKFAAVPQWRNGGFEKPKFHPSEHLEEQLEEFGPFRAFWCFPWEAYLQVSPPRPPPTPSKPPARRPCASSELLLGGRY